jgi:2-succinyl-6-hydroxy-2,4-cyclohexadiene-1-carboxylate synthase
MPLDPRDQHDAAPPLCWLHGFTQTGRSAHVFRSILAARRELLAPDLPGHGDRWAQHGSLDEIADLVAGELPDGVVDLGGYSFGARVAAHLALAHPDRVRRLVLISATRGLANEADRGARRARDERLAQRVEEIGAEAFIDEWLAQPMFAELPNDPRERDARRDQHAAGLASSLREAGTGTQRWLGDELAALPTPTLVLAGASDERFAREALAMVTPWPSATAQLVPGAGHAVALHQPAWSARVVECFLAGSVGGELGDHERDPER